MAGRQDNDNAKVLKTLDEQAVIDMNKPKKAVYTGKPAIKDYLESKPPMPYVKIVSVGAPPKSLQDGKATVEFTLKVGLNTWVAIPYSLKATFEFNDDTNLITKVTVD